MPLIYSTGENDTLLEDNINTQQPYPGGFIDMGQPVDARGERYRNIVEFDLTSKVSYDAMVVEYPTAWDEYYDESAPAYSAENALKLQEAIKFYLYIHEGETANVDDFDEGGILPDYQNAFEEQPRLSPYMHEGGSTYENPNAFYDKSVYDNVVGGDGLLPLVQMDGDSTITARTSVNANLSDMYSTEQLALKEYQVSRSTPKSSYDWGGSYAVGKNTY